MLIDTDARSLHLYSLEHCVGSIDGRLALLIVLGDSLLDGTIKLQLVRPGLAVDDLKLTGGVPITHRKVSSLQKVFGKLGVE